MEKNRDYAKSFKRVNKVKERVKNCRLIFCLIRNNNSLQKQFITMELTIIVVMVYSTFRTFHTKSNFINFPSPEKFKISNRYLPKKPTRESR